MKASDASSEAPHRLTLVQAASLLRDGALRAEDYVTALLARCHAGAGLNAFSAIDDQAVLAAAREADLARAAGQPLGQLHGIPLALKDNIASERLPTTAGTAALAGVGVKVFRSALRYRCTLRSVALGAPSSMNSS